MSDFEVIATTESFYKVYENNMRKTKSYKDAYELTEIDHIHRYGARKYSGYESFKANRSRYMKKGDDITP